jgi:hypothetical protein
MGIQSTTIASLGLAKLEAMIDSGQGFHGRDTVSRMSPVPFKITCSPRDRLHCDGHPPYDLISEMAPGSIRLCPSKS